MRMRMAFSSEWYKNADIDIVHIRAFACKMI